MRWPYAIVLSATLAWHPGATGAGAPSYSHDYCTALRAMEAVGAFDGSCPGSDAVALTPDQRVEPHFQCGRRYHVAADGFSLSAPLAYEHFLRAWQLADRSSEPKTSVALVPAAKKLERELPVAIRLEVQRKVSGRATTHHVAVKSRGGRQLERLEPPLDVFACDAPTGSALSNTPSECTTPWCKCFDTNGGEREDCRGASVSNIDGTALSFDFEATALPGIYTFELELRFAAPGSGGVDLTGARTYRFQKHGLLPQCRFGTSPAERPCRFSW